MWKRLRKCILHYKSMDVASMSKSDKEDAKRSLLTEIGFFQHERLIHLLVTLAFAFFIFLSGLAYCLSPDIMWLILLGALISLEFPYIIHYFHLENGVQALYGIYRRFG